MGSEFDKKAGQIRRSARQDKYTIPLAGYVPWMHRQRRQQGVRIQCGRDLAKRVLSPV
jgi:hypothetical protein